MNIDEKTKELQRRLDELCEQIRQCGYSAALVQSMAPLVNLDDDKQCDALYDWLGALIRDLDSFKEMAGGARTLLPKPPIGAVRGTRCVPT